MATVLFIAANTRSLVANRGDLIRQFKKQGYEVHAIVPRYDFLEIINSLEIPYTKIDLNRTGINPFKDFVAIRQLRSLIKKINPDIVFSYGIKPVIYGTIVSSYSKVSKISTMITGLGYLFTGESIKQRFLREIAVLLYRFSLNKADVTFFQNNDDLNLFLKLNIFKDSNRCVIVNGSGVNLEYFKYTSPVLNPIKFLLIARLIKDKGIYEFVEASRLIKLKYPFISIDIIGPHDPNLPNSIPLEQVNEWKKLGIINFLGSVADVRNNIASASVFVLPSYREGTPRSVLEAMAMGKPIITTDAPGCRETVIHNSNGFLVPVMDVDRLFIAMEKFILNPELIGCMGMESFRIASEKYDVNLVNKSIINSLILKNV